MSYDYNPFSRPELDTEPADLWLLISEVGHVVRAVLAKKVMRHAVARAQETRL
jgi:hypothetical protein